MEGQAELVELAEKAEMADITTTKIPKNRLLSWAVSCKINSRIANGGYANGGHGGNANGGNAHA